jgi:hypothetical protein
LNSGPHLRIVFLINGVEKTGIYIQNNETIPLFYTIQKQKSTHSGLKSINIKPESIKTPGENIGGNIKISFSNYFWVLYQKIKQ